MALDEVGGERPQQQNRQKDKRQKRCYGGGYPQTMRATSSEYGGADFLNITVTFVAVLIDTNSGNPRIREFNIFLYN